MREPTGKDFVRMGVAIALCAAFCAVMVLASGCATGRLVAMPVNGGARLVYVSNADAVVDPTAEQPTGFWQNHWGKVLSAVGAAGAIALVGENNGWWDGNKSGGGSPGDYNGHNVTINGDNNRVNISSDGDVVGDDAMAE